MGLFAGILLISAWQSAPQPAQPAPRTLPPPPVAEDVFNNIKVLQGSSAADVIPTMVQIGNTLGVDCAYCHVPHEWANDQKPPKETTRKMFDMLGYINTAFFPQQRKVSCWACHRGQPKPEQYKNDDEATARVAKLINLAPGSEEKPSQEVFKNIQKLKGVPAGRFPRIMQMFSVSLGVRCSQCHVPGEWARDDKPDKQRAREMLSMAASILGKYYNGNGPVGCFTCHHGVLKPALEAAKPASAAGS